MWCSSILELGFLNFDVRAVSIWLSQVFSKAERPANEADDVAEDLEGHGGPLAGSCCERTTAESAALAAMCAKSI